MKIFGKKRIDERQEQEIWKIGCRAWQAAAILLCLSFFVKSVILELPLREWMSDLLIFLAVDIYTLICYVRKGIWSGWEPAPNPRSNLLWSLMAAFAASVLMTTATIMRNGYGGSVLNILAVFVVYFMMFFVAVLFVFMVAERAFFRQARKTKKKLDAEEEQDAEEE